MKKGVNMKKGPSDSFTKYKTGGVVRKYEGGTSGVNSAMPGTKPLITSRMDNIPTGNEIPLIQQNTDKALGTTRDMSKLTQKPVVPGLSNTGGVLSGIGGLFNTYGTIRGGDKGSDAVKTGALFSNIGSATTAIKSSNDKKKEDALKLLPVVARKGINLKSTKTPILKKGMNYGC